MKERSKISVYLTRDEKGWLKSLARKNRRSMSNQARDILLKDYKQISSLSKKEKKNEVSITD